MTDIWLQRYVGLFAATLLAVSCGGDEDGKGENDDWLGANSNPKYCADMPGDELAKVAIDQQGQNRWSIRYPVARRGCGAYHLSATFDLAPRCSAHLSTGTRTEGSQRRTPTKFARASCGVPFGSRRATILGNSLQRRMQSGCFVDRLR